MDLAYIVLLIAAYAFLGASTKYVDLASKRSPKSRKALSVALAASLSMAFLIFSDANSAAILFGIVLAVFIAGKLNTLALKLGALIASAGFLLALAAKQFNAASWIALPAIAVAGVLDEFFNDYADKQSVLGAKVLGPKGFFLKHRMAAKAIVLGLVLAKAFSWPYFAAFLAFDIAYDMTETLQLQS